MFFKKVKESTLLFSMVERDLYTNKAPNLLMLTGEVWKVFSNKPFIGLNVIDEGLKRVPYRLRKSHRIRIILMYGNQVYNIYYQDSKVFLKRNSDYASTVLLYRRIVSGLYQGGVFAVTDAKYEEIYNKWYMKFTRERLTKEEQDEFFEDCVEKGLSIADVCSEFYVRNLKEISNK